MDSSEVEIIDENIELKKYFCALCQVSFGCQNAWDSYVHEDCKFYHMHQKKNKKDKKKAKLCEKRKNHLGLNGNRNNEIRSEIQNDPNKNYARNKRKRERRKRRHEKKFEEANTAFEKAKKNEMPKGATMFMEGIVIWVV